MSILLILLLPIIAVVVTAPFGATILGWMAVSQIRRSGGKLCGMGLALFAGLVFPLLALDGVIGLISYKLYMATSWAGGNVQPSHVSWILMAIILSVMADISIILWTWLAVNKPLGGDTGVPPAVLKPRVSLGWAFGVAAVHVVVFAGVVGFFLFVTPHYVASFKHANIALPVLTQFVISISDIFKQGWYLLVLPLAGLNLLVLLGLRLLRIRALFWTWAIAVILVCAATVSIGYASLNLVSKKAAQELARQEQRVKISQDLRDAIMRQFKQMGIQRYQVHVGLNSNDAEPRIRLEDVQKQEEIAGSNVWVAVKGSLHARDLGGGNWEVTGSEELGDVHLAVKTAPLPELMPSQQLAKTDWMLQPATTNVYYENKYWQIDVGVFVNGRPARQAERRELAGRLKGIYKASAPNGGGEQSVVSGFWHKNGVEGLTLQVTPDPGHRLNPGTRLTITITDSKSKRQQIITATIPDDNVEAQIPESGKQEAKPVIGSDVEVIQEFDFKEYSRKRVIVDGTPALKIENSSNATKKTRFLKLDAPLISATKYAVTGEIKYENVQGNAYLEMWSYFSPSEKYFTRTQGTSGYAPMTVITGPSGWRPFSLPFDRSGATNALSKIEVYLWLPRKGGVVYLRGVKLVQQAAVPTKVTASVSNIGIVESGPDHRGFRYTVTNDQSLVLWAGTRDQAVHLLVPAGTAGGTGRAKLEAVPEGLVLTSGGQKIGPIAVNAFTFASGKVIFDPDGSLIVGHCSEGRVGIRVGQAGLCPVAAREAVASPVSVVAPKADHAYVEEPGSNKSVSNVVTQVVQQKNVNHRTGTDPKKRKVGVVEFLKISGFVGFLLLPVTALLVVVIILVACFSKSRKALAVLALVALFPLLLGLVGTAAGYARVAQVAWMTPPPEAAQVQRGQEESRYPTYLGLGCTLLLLSLTGLMSVIKKRNQ